MAAFSFMVMGEPLALKRHRTMRAKNGINLNYDPSGADKNDFLMAALAVMGAERKLLTGPLMVKMKFCFSRPKGHYGTGKNSDVVKASAPKFHTKTPDADNLAKFVGDALNGKVWADDSQIVYLEVYKQYTCNRPYTEITITEA